VPFHTSGFRAEFDYDIFGGSEADGIVLAFVPDPTYEALAGGGLDFPCEAGSGAYGIEFDTYPFNDNDPANRHIGVIKDCASNHLFTVDQETRGSHHVQIDMVNGTVEVRFDGVLVLTHAIAGFTPALIYFGLTSATGTFSDTHVIDNFWLMTPLGFVVNHTGDGADANVGNGVCETLTPGQCTLRAAIQQANATVGPDPISFDIPTSDPGYDAESGTWKIQPGTVLPTITQPAALDATTQPGYIGTPKFELSGESLGGSVNGLAVSAGSSLIRGLTINRFPNDGIELVSSGNIIAGNYIGTDVTGTLDLGNAGEGIYVNGSATNVIDDNLISGNNGRGIAIQGPGANGNTVTDNLIGMTKTGAGDLGNGAFGVLLSDAVGTEMGSAGSGNVISGNGFDGVYISGGSANIVRGNRIGTNSPAHRRFRMAEGWPCSIRLRR
jgi:CSLREA domain-containing protein